MKFAHMSDVHLGVWSNHPELKELPQRAFVQAIDECLKKKVDFIVISGDLFDTSIPSIDVINTTAIKLRECRDANVRVYVVPGSHDYSPTGKTMITVFESSGLLKNVANHETDGGKINLKFTVDESGAKLTGMPGKTGSLEHSIYDLINRDYLEKEDGFKIFVMHSAIEEFRPKGLEKMPALPISKIPRNFDYYANGHVHEKFSSAYDRGVINLPGPMFPASFSEMEENMCGYYIINKDSRGMDVTWHRIKLCDVKKISLSAEGKSVVQVESELMESVDQDFSNTIVLVKVRGTLATGKPGEINFKNITEQVMARGAIAVKKNTNKLVAKEFVEIEPQENIAIEQVEKEIILNHRDQIKLEDFPAEIVEKIMNVLDEEKLEGETVATFEERFKSNMRNILNL